MTTVKGKGLTSRDLREAARQAFEALGELEKYERWVKRVDYNARLGRAGGQADMYKLGGHIQYVEIWINPTLDFDQLKDVMRHEAAHVITGLGDSDLDFKIYCHKHSIPLVLRDGVRSAQRWQVKCSECDKILANYARKGKRVKQVLAGDDRLSCGSCGSSDLEVLDNRQQLKREMV